MFVVFGKLSYLCIAFEKSRATKWIGALVQLVRIHACHAWGHGFESRTHRKIFELESSTTQVLFCLSYREYILLYFFISQ